MTLYAASHLVWVGVSADHGGCGAPGGHGRPVENGAPVKLWALDCPDCEQHLRHDQHWSSTISKIPETYDEAIRREDFDKRGVLDERRLMAMALAKLTGLELPDTLAQAITGTIGIIPPSQVALCKDGHQNAPAVKFCGECGVPMTAGVGATMPALAPPQSPAPPSAPSSGNGTAPQAWSPPRDGQGRKKPLRDWRLEDLQAFAASKGLATDGNRTELITRLRDAKKETAAAA